MNPQELVDYLKRLLGRNIGLDDWITLSSGQQARTAAWMADRIAVPEDLRARISVPFQPIKVLAVGDDRVEAQVVNASTTAVSSSFVDSSLSGIGIDIQSVGELVPNELLGDPKSSSELTQVFTLREISYAQSQPSVAETLTGIFAAKEAIRKCDSRLMSLPLLQIEVLPEPRGRPCYPGFALSISHSGGFAIAVAICEPSVRNEPATALRALPTVDAENNLREQFKPRREAAHKLIHFVASMLVFALVLIVIWNMHKL
jgi:phosphopantetheine--protein transferase-like protein